MIDRLTPCERPDIPLIGYQNWRDLLFLHWEVDISFVRDLVPGHLELDLWSEQALVGIVPFSMENVRPKWAPSWSAFNFYELNLRTYVTYQGEPGVYFFSLDAASWIAVCTARLGWSLPYYPASFKVDQSSTHVHYHMKRRLPATSHFEVHYQLGRDLGASAPGGIEHFLLERYLLFTLHRGAVYRGQVYHTPYPAQEAEITHYCSNLLEQTGLPPLLDHPTYIHYARGVDVEIFPLKAC